MMKKVLKMSVSGDANSLERIAPVVLVIAALVMFVGAAIPFVTPSLSEAPWSDDPALLAPAIANNPAPWALANGLILLAAIITGIALTPITLNFTGASRSWAAAGLVAFLFGAVFAALDRMISAQVVTWAAETGLDSSDPSIQPFLLLDNSLGSAFVILSFVAIALFGMAMVEEENVAGIGWLFVAGGVFGVILQLIGAAIPGFVFLGTGALGIVRLSIAPGVTATADQR